MELSQVLKEKEWALEDLIRIKENGTYNEYVTEKNIDQWIDGQKAEIEKLKGK
jgi:hypothetical protein